MIREVKSRCALSALFILWLSLSFSQVTYHDPLKNLQVHNNQLLFLEDRSAHLGITDVLNRSDFLPVPGSGDVPNFGITNSAVWLKFTLINETTLPIMILKISQPIIDEVDFFAPDSLGTYKAIRLGEYHPFGLRTYQTPDYLFDIEIEPKHSKTLYLRLKCRENMQVPLSIGSRVSTFNSSVNSNLASGIYVGIMIVMILYNLFIYLIFRDKSYILYSIYIIMVLLTQTNLQGYTFQFLWPGIPGIALYSQFFFPSLVGLTAIEFFKEFLHLKDRMLLAFRISFLFYIPYIFAPLLSLFGYYSVSFAIIDATASIASLFMLYVTFMVYRRGYSEARFFLIGWFVFLIGVCVYVLKDFEVLPYNNFTRYGMHIGSAIEVILLSFALAERINILKKEKEQSQAEALLISQQNQKLITEQNIILEQKVHERTLELEETNDELNVTLTHLKDTQTQLVNVEKMASLGQLTAGIAHEINNPINFVSANLKPLKLDISEVFDVVNRYGSLTAEDGIADKLKEIDAFKKKIDLDYLKHEIGTLLNGIEDGARRTTEIVAGLKNFSRLDESDIKEANINEGIESTLVILRSSIPNEVEVITDLGDIPHIECYPGKLNQVFMNIISNGIYALKQKKDEGKNRLRITTYVRGDHVCATFADTGIGMSEEVKNKMFEPFFTTKDVGEGTGLGMSIVFKIIESHHAKMEVESTLGKGTVITIVLNRRISDKPRKAETPLFVVNS